MMTDSSFPLTCRGARRVSRRFARVGVQVPATRLQAIAAGARLTSVELTDFSFALLATETEREERLAKLRQARCRGMRWLMYLGLSLAGSGALCCLFFAVTGLALHELPY